MDFTRSIELDTTYDDAITSVKEALKEQASGYSPRSTSARR